MFLIQSLHRLYLYISLKIVSNGCADSLFVDFI